MFRCFETRSSKDSGLSLVEIVVAMAVSAIVFTGMLVTYLEGVEYTRENSNMMTLYGEGKVALEQMGWWIRQAARVRISSYGGVSNARMRLNYNDAWGGGDAEFYFSRAAKELRWSDRTEGKRKLHMTLLPILNIDAGPYEEPYLKVKDCRFTPLDHIGAPSPYLEGYWLIKVEMVLEDDRGDTLYLSSVYSKRNKLF
ncbi:MAG: prepilin-type N-terminal cleavage/methylation domain-containing protein [Candidatus Zixiibacteriota bacterium]|nr:MAG: prepilin-type N-terminal cleavage/methylation domain-containing protein [candidate division Zixibacteria bacterium]